MMIFTIFSLLLITSVSPAPPLSNFNCTLKEIIGKVTRFECNVNDDTLNELAKLFAFTRNTGMRRRPPRI